MELFLLFTSEMSDAPSQKVEEDSPDSGRGGGDAGEVVVVVVDMRLERKKKKVFFPNIIGNIE